MQEICLSKNQWNKIHAFLKTQAQNRRIYIGREGQCQRFLEAILWIARSGAQWRLLPEKYGNWNHVYKRFAHWNKQGIFEALMKHFANNSDLKHLMLDSTITRAHPCAAGALKKTAAKTNKHSDVHEVASARRYTF